MGRTKSGLAGRQAAAAETIRIHQRRERRRKLLIYGVGAFILATLVTVTAVLLVGAQANKAAIRNAATKPITGVQTFAKLTRNHTATPGHYAQNPPVGGDHSPVFLNCGIYRAPVTEGRAVHSLEHGAVWVTYSPTLAGPEVAALTDQAKSQSYEILSPRANLPSPIVASAWGVQLQVSTANDQRLAEFLSKYEQGPQTPEPGAACSGAPAN
ncbi:MAG: DUF3105 domain-containing protein [Acidobacteria bacterium]|nr:DUF3105 domain-containing protein [Acidobacteriota bacterium]